jgi:hypothetical protein
MVVTKRTPGKIDLVPARGMRIPLFRRIGTLPSSATTAAPPGYRRPTWNPGSTGDIDIPGVGLKVPSCAAMGRRAEHLPGARN